MGLYSRKMEDMDFQALHKKSSPGLKNSFLPRFGP